MSEFDDIALMQLAGADREDAFSELVRRHRDFLLSFFMRKGISHADGQDLAQRTFLRLWNYRKKYSPQAKFTTFLFHLAGQECIDFFRSAQRRLNLLESFKRGSDLTCQSSGFEFFDGSESSGHCVNNESLHHAIAQLSAGQREVIELGIMKELPYCDVARMLNVPVGTVKSRMFNAIRKMRVILTASGCAVIVAGFLILHDTCHEKPTAAHNEWSVAELAACQLPDGTFTTSSASPYIQAFAVTALARDTNQVNNALETAVAVIVKDQGADGGWANATLSAQNVAALRLAADAGVPDAKKAYKRGLRYLHSHGIAEMSSESLVRAAQNALKRVNKSGDRKIISILTLCGKQEIAKNDNSAMNRNPMTDVISGI